MSLKKTIIYIYYSILILSSNNINVFSQKNFIGNWKIYKFDSGWNPKLKESKAIDLINSNVKIENDFIIKKDEKIIELLNVEYLSREARTKEYMFLKFKISPTVLNIKSENITVIEIFLKNSPNKHLFELMFIDENSIILPFEGYFFWMHKFE
jgi:hypothetical protein